MSTTEPVHVRGGERATSTRPEPLPRLQRLVDADAGAQSLTVLVNELRPGQRIPPHRHDVEEVLVVTTGACTVRAAERDFEARAGDAVIVAAGVVHEVRSAGAESGKVIGVLASSTPQFEPVGDAHGRP